MRCCRRILKVCWNDKVSNKLAEYIIVDLIKQRKVKIRHICRMNLEQLMKTVMIVMVEVDQTHGRPARRWSSDWCDCILPEAVHLALNRKK